MRVLYVDDHSFLRTVVKRVLERRGIEVVLCASVEEAMARDNFTFDLIVCDVHMPPAWGHEFYWWLSREHPSTLDAFVFVSGTTDYKMPREMPEGVPVLPKPFDVDQLLALARH